MTMSEKLKVSIANWIICLDLEDGILVDPIARRYDSFLQDQECTFCISVNLVQSSSFDPQKTKQQIDFQEGKIYYRDSFANAWVNSATHFGEFNTIHPSVGSRLDYFLRVLIAYLTFKDGGLLVHAAGVLRNGKGYLFLGPSGSGKTTIARLSSQGKVLNDDLLVLLPSSTGWEVFSTPFTNQDQVRPRAGRMPLSCMFRLEHGKSNRVEPFSAAAALAEFIASVPVIPGFSQYTSDVLNRAQLILSRVPFDKLYFTPDSSIWELIDTGL